MNYILIINFSLRVGGWDTCSTVLLCLLWFSGLTRDGADRADPVLSPDQILRQERGQGRLIS